MKAAVHQPWMIYGAYGFTGRLIAEAALRRGHRPVLAGRNAAKLTEVAQGLGLTAMPLSLDEKVDFRSALQSVSLVFNASGPFSETGLPMIEACLEAGTSYADISGELDHLRAVAALDERARQAGIALLPGAGFGVTLGDCLARHVIGRLPDATHLRVSIAVGNAQRTSAVRRTIVNVIAGGGYAIEEGKWRRRSLGHKCWTVRHRGKDQTFAAAPMGELAALFHSTGIGNILVGRPMPATAARILRTLSPLIQAGLSLAPLRHAAGASPVAPTRGVKPARIHRSWLMAEAHNACGERAAAVLECGEGYAVTAEAAVLNSEALLECRLAGVLTPACAFGAGHALKIPGVRLTDV